MRVCVCVCEPDISVRFIDTCVIPYSWMYQPIAFTFFRVPANRK